MTKYIVKAAIFILCAAFYRITSGAYFIVPLICTVIISALMSYADGAGRRPRRRRDFWRSAV
jgi:hypothetical protein